ncbi:MAG TPA: glycosyltransferase family 2 protein, partial [Flavisolibacter sp.]
NEERCIEQKIRNSLQQQYPADKLELIFITDGSTDRTNTIISEYPEVRLLYQPERRGKSAAINRAADAAQHGILVFSDANTALNPQAVMNIARHYADPRTGGVAGEKKVMDNPAARDAAIGEGLYWKYESFLKQVDSDFYSVIGAAGELFSVRKSLYRPVDDDVILDDFVISMQVAGQGYRVVYEPQAYATEPPSLSITEERKRKVRIGAGSFQALQILRPLLFSSRYPGLSFLYLSHRVLRWTLSPVCLFLIFISNMVLAATTDNLFFTITFAMQVLFYLMALLGTFLPVRLFRLAHYFVFMHLSVIQGFFRYINDQQPAAWEKVER